MKDDHLIAELMLLPCFNAMTITNITRIKKGLSNPCYRVVCDHKDFFVKYTGKSNVGAKVHAFVAQAKLASNVYYYNDIFLVTDFLPWLSLADDDKKTVDEKCQITIDLLAQFHVKTQKEEQLISTIDLSVLETKNIIKNLLNKCSFSKRKHLFITQLAEKLESSLTKTINKQADLNYILCHGDANFSNILSSKKVEKNSEAQYQLIDFECASIAPAEYDLAMFMAINGVALTNIDNVIEKYNYCLRQDNNLEITTLSQELIKCYFDLSLLINALWCVNEYKKDKKSPYKIISNKQFSMLAIRYPNYFTQLTEVTFEL